MSKYVAKGINVACRTIDGIAFIFREDNRELLRLDPVGSFIWDQINGRRTMRQIIVMCQEAFEGDSEEIAIAVDEFMVTLIKRGVVVESDEPFEGVMASAC